jgi:hypothetical protein
VTARLTAQALFLHERLVLGALDEPALGRLDADVKRRQAVALGGDEQARTSAFEQVVATLCAQAPELAVAVVEGELSSGEMVTLTQNFYIRRDSEERGSFTARLDIDREVAIQGGFSTSWLIGATGQTETFGHHRFAMLAYVTDVELQPPERKITLRPLFIGWRMIHVSGRMPELDDRHELWVQQIDQFSEIAGLRAGAKDVAAVAAMPEEEVKNAFAEIVGEPFIPKDWGGETSDLFTSRLSRSGDPLSAAFAFKGPALKGPLHIAGMGKRGDQGLRLAQEDADLLVVQHHSQIAADVRNLMSAISRQHGRLYTTIDGETTARILRTYGKLP